MMMMMNCFCDCGVVDRRKAFSLVSSRDHCQRSSPSRISDTPRAGFEPAQSLSSDLVEWSCAVVITATPQRHESLFTGFFLEACNFIKKDFFYRSPLDDCFWFFECRFYFLNPVYFDYESVKSDQKFLLVFQFLFGFDHYLFMFILKIHI